MEEMKKLQFRIPPGMEIRFDGKSLLQRKVDTINSSPGNLKDYHCPKCMDRGYHAYLEDGRMITRECGCMHIRRCIRKLQESGLNPDLKEYQLSNFHVESPWQQDMLDLAKGSIADPEGWTLFSGQCGCGKTFLSLCIARSILMQEKPLLYFSWGSNAQWLKSYENAREKEEKLKVYQDAPYLYIDDFLKPAGNDRKNPRCTGPEISAAFQLINSRYERKKPTIISTELNLDELVALNEGLGSRILEMTRNRNVVIRWEEGRNYRLRP